MRNNPLIHNRDKNALINMLAIVQSVMEMRKRSVEFTREPSYAFYDVL